MGYGNGTRVTIIPSVTCETVSLHWGMDAFEGESHKLVCPRKSGVDC